MPERRSQPPRLVHQNLDTAYVNLAALLRHLQQRNFTGLIHVELDEYDADISLTPHNHARIRERDHATGREAEGEAALRRLLVRAGEPGGLISVYEQVSADDALTQAQAGAATPHESLVESAAGLSEAEIDRRDVLQLSGELIAAVERALVNASTEDFAPRFQQARAVLAVDYPFLASLANCLEEVNGVSLLRRDVSLNLFVHGVCEALRRVVEGAASRDEMGRSVRIEVARELTALRQRRPKSLARFKFTPQLERIAGARST